MKAIHNASKQELASSAAEELKKIKEITPPEWADFVKTGNNKERPPSQDDWWYRRSASVLLKVKDLGPVGVSKLKHKYGSKKRRGHQPAIFKEASGNIIRKILQQLEAAGLVKQDSKEVHKGRVITGKGVSLLTQSVSKKSKGNKDGNTQSPKQKN